MGYLIIICVVVYLISRIGKGNKNKYCHHQWKKDGIDMDDNGYYYDIHRCQSCGIIKFHCDHTWRKHDMYNNGGNGYGYTEVFKCDKCGEDRIINKR